MPTQSDSSQPGRHVTLPDAPSHLKGPVKAWREPVSILTYQPEPPDRNPMFLEKRVYQGSSGKVYPLPFIDRIAREPHQHLWDAIHIENEYLRLMVLPEIGGRIHIGFDKISGYDFFYRQEVIKPALVGLAGPWISGGVEFNWPQHHRPATYMPVETEIEHGPAGEVTIWCSDHDPILHMKGMHGVSLSPGCARLDLKVRLYNRTQLTQTFLWWANVATRVHERYQSFFPTDVRFVADHAKRAVTTFPLSDRPYYGVDYPARAAHGVPADELPAHFRPDGSYAANDLSWYANIPVPTSYMIAGTAQDFFGGYDHRAQAGVVHVANHHVSPGKKQWTWGNHEFGYAWDRSLTDPDLSNQAAPYIELMAGVYTDNQPDFSYLAPWETKTFTQIWYPLRGTGIPQMANADAALHLDMHSGQAHIAVAVTRNVPGAQVQLLADGNLLHQWSADLDVTHTFTASIDTDAPAATLAMKVICGDRILIDFDPAAIDPAPEPEAAQEPLPAPDMPSVEELYLTGVHLDQYRHATRSPELYWREALRRDPGESRCHTALGLWHMRRGEFDAAQSHLQQAVRRRTRLNPNPNDGEAHYSLGIVLRLQTRTPEAYDALYKSTWNAAWRGPAYFALAEIDAARADWPKAEDHLRRALRAEADNLNARNLLAHVLRVTGRDTEASAQIADTLALDPLDIGARWLQGHAPTDGQLLLDLTFDLLRSGRTREALHLLETADMPAAGSAAPMLLLTLADLQASISPADEAATLAHLERIPHTLCAPNRLEELLVLQRTVARHPTHALAWYLLGNLLYDIRRHDEAIEAWQSAAVLQPAWPTVWRNLGIAYFNIRHDADAAGQAFDRAFANDPTDGRILYERDHLWKRLGRAPELRLAELLAHRDLVTPRDDLSVELATLYNQLGQHAEALDLMLSRTFQPWEGGEGLVLGQYVRAYLLLGRRALETGDAATALRLFDHALHPPHSLSEARHLLANQSDVYFWIGSAHHALGHQEASEEWFNKAVRHRGDFQQMSTRTISDMTFWKGLALRQLGQQEQAQQLFREILAHGEALERTTPKIDYFATSLPAMLLFDDDLDLRNRIDAAFLKAQAHLGLGDTEEAQRLLQWVLTHDVNHPGAQDLSLVVIPEGNLLLAPPFVVIPEGNLPLAPPFVVIPEGNLLLAPPFVVIPEGNLLLVSKHVEPQCK